MMTLRRPQRSTRMAVLTLLLALVGHRLWPVVASADERTLSDAPVRLVTSDDSSIFPESWRSPSIAASGRALAESDVERVLAILDRAIAKYPPAVLERYLRVVYVLSDLKYRGITASGTNSRTAVYLKIGPIARGFTDDHIERVFHAELSSILLRENAERFDEQLWTAHNPPSFRYLGDGVEAVKQNRAGLGRSDLYHRQGFLKQYSTSALENDFNAFASLLFLGDPSEWELTDRHPSLAKKRALTIAFYQSLDPAMTEDYFRQMIVPEASPQGSPTAGSTAAE